MVVDMIYVCSDIHGQYSLYRKMLEGIKFSDNDELYLLGDLIDRGPESDKLLLDVMSHDNVSCLVGNHELLMYAHYSGDKENDYWFYSGNGGKTTKHQLNQLTAQQNHDIEDYLFNNTYLQVELELNNQKYLLSHSYFVKDHGTIKDWKEFYNDPYFYNNDALKTVWYSPWRHSEYMPKRFYNEDERIHIIGHVPVQSARKDDNEIGRWEHKSLPHQNPDRLEAYIDGNIINIDGGCARLKDKGDYGLICMNLTAYSEGKEAFTYYRP